MRLADLIKKGSLRGLATATVATVATHEPTSPTTVARVATVAVAKSSEAAIDLATLDPVFDRWCWPHSPAMTTVEIDTLALRVAYFLARGIGLELSEKLADRLVVRDREEDDRRICLECLSLVGSQNQGWFCANWAPAGFIGGGVWAQLAPDFMYQLQRCDGFSVQQGVNHECK